MMDNGDPGNSSFLSTVAMVVSSGPKSRIPSMTKMPASPAVAMMDERI